MGSCETKAEDSQSTRTLILSAALKEFSEFGFDGTSVRKIGKRASVDFTLITYYFKTKENLWKEVIENGIERYYEIVNNHTEINQAITAEERLRARLEGELEFVYSDDSLFKIIMKEIQQGNTRSEWVYQYFIRRNQREILDLITHCQKEGKFVGIDPFILTKVMQTSVRSLLLFSEDFKAQDNKEYEDKEQKKQVVKDQLWTLLDSIYFGKK